MNLAAEGVLPGSVAEHELQLTYGTEEQARRFYDNSVLGHLNERMTAFIDRQEMVFISTADATGACDASFRAGPPGFVRVVDSGRLAYPEYRGNGVMASLANISENQHVGMLFVDFLIDQVGLHVNGTARIVEAEESAGLGLDTGDPAAPPGRRPQRWVVVEVDEAYIHCSKHIPRLARVERPTRGEAGEAKRKGGDYFATSAQARGRVLTACAAGCEDDVERPPEIHAMLPGPRRSAIARRFLGLSRRAAPGDPGGRRSAG